MKELVIDNEESLDLHCLRDFLNTRQPICLHESCHKDILTAREFVEKVVRLDKPIYSINTGFGSLLDRRIAKKDLEMLQENLILSHASGVGKPMTEQVVRLILLLKINSLAQGYSGVRLELIEALVRLCNSEIVPFVPEQGSVGASGDLAPLAHIATLLIGQGEAFFKGKLLPATKALGKVGIKPTKLSVKEGLSLINGTEASTALALSALFTIEDVFAAAMVAGSLSTVATVANEAPFDARVHERRGQLGQKKVANSYRKLLDNSEILFSSQHAPRAQAPYSIRCQPQVMGACLDQLQFAANVLEREANAVSDNPLIFCTEGDIVTGGNFHAEPVAMAADNLALCIAEVGSLSERRIALLTNETLSCLPAFLAENNGLNSGFMNAQVCAAALVSENKGLAHPACVDSIPTSANQEDHVSMATYAARRLHAMAENAAHIIAIELLAACQGLDFHAPLCASERLEVAKAAIRKRVPHLDKDRMLAPDIAAIKDLITSGYFKQFVADDLFNV